jgi:H+/Cl- antiporter ClcA
MGVVFGSAASQGLGTDRVVTMAALMVACNVGVTKTVVGSTLVVAEMGGMPLLPPALIAGVVALFLTSRVSMIETQRDREGEIDEPRADEEEPIVGRARGNGDSTRKGERPAHP